MNSAANIEAPDMVEEEKKEYHIIGDIIQVCCNTAASCHSITYLMVYFNR